MAGRRTKIGEQFSTRVIRMLESPAYRVLSQSAHRVLSRVEVEHAHHGGKDNGKLPVTFKDFEKYGIDRHAVAPAMREAVALGFLEVTEHGRAGNAEYRAPNMFRLTYLHSSRCNPTHEWAKIDSIELATALAVAARKNKKPPRRRKKKKKKPVVEKTRFSAGNPHRKRKSPVGETPTTGPGGEPPTTSISGGGDQTQIANSVAGVCAPSVVTCD